ncbi:MAG: beta-N-acetylglucosaminidase domain-containing protein, partial [Propionibacteriales bacterium]|nr:beta-N-acetylglucosaminidase domain-containing protein [Propionibacteriales bacterium]
MRVPVAALLGGCLMLTIVFVPGSAAAAPPVPAIHPTPTRVSTDRTTEIDLRGRVTVVADEQAHPTAVAALREMLTRTRSQVRVVSPAQPLPAGGTVVVLGTSEDAQVQRLAAAAGLADSESLATDEGYVVHPTTDGRRKVVLLAGHDQRGVFYAVQTLRQLITGTKVAAATVEDAPLMSIRGVVEGFYGFPWSHQARLDQLAFYGEHKMNTYIYTPKDDELLRKRWREPYTGDDLAQLQELITTAKANQVDFVFALSPGNDLCYTSADDLAATKAKFASLYELGVRDFYIALDDIGKTLTCQADKDAYPGEPMVALAKAQAGYLNRVNEEFIQPTPEVNPLHMVPTSYTGSGPTPYKTALGAEMDSDILVQWTGEKVVSHEITLDSATRARTSYGTTADPREISIWDNYPVNDFAQDRLFLGSVRKRDPQLHTQLLGFTSNPMIQPYASLPTIANYADYAWNPPAYDAEESMATALAEMAGPDKAVQKALTTFADLNNNWQDDPDYPNAPELSADVAAFWAELDKGTTTPVALDGRLADIEALRTALAPMANQGFRADAEDWILAATQWGAASRHALAMVRAAEAGDLSGAVEQRAAVIANRQLALRATHETLAKGTLT